MKGFDMRVKTSKQWSNMWLTMLLFVLLTFTNSATYGQVTLDREHDPVVILGSQLPEFVGFPISYIHVYAYRADIGEWEVIPYQIDEKKDSSATSFFDFEKHNGLLCETDELVFMVKDMGDQAPDSTVWLDDRESKRYRRYKIAVTDTVQTPKAWVYVFHSPTIGNDLSLDPYVIYDPVNDVVSGNSYIVAHNPDTASGLPTSISIPTAVGGDDLDFLDRWRLRINIYASGKFNGITFTIPDFLVKERMNNVTIIDLFGYDLKISVFRKRSPDYISGPIRVLRNMHFGIRLEGSVLENPKESEFVLQSSYYRTFTDFPPYPQEIPEIPPISEGKIRVTKFFIGAAHNSRVYNSRYYSPDPEYLDLPIDDNHNDEPDRNTLMPWPGSTWYGLTVDPEHSVHLTSATVLSIIRMHGQAPDATYSRYFHTYDNVDEARRYGIMGFKLENESESIQGKLDVLIRNFYFGENFSHQQMAEFAEKYSKPLQIDTTSTYRYDVIPPAQITNLTVSSFDDSSATLLWTAVGDDGMSGGSANRYMIRYSDQPQGSDYWWVWWSKTIPAVNIPKPGQPYTQESITITGLDKNTIYYFAIRALDVAENPSELSEIVVVTTTPVELASFNASASRGQVELVWTTVSETNNLGFEIQRRFDSDAEWQVLGFVEGAGTTNEPQSYKFVDQVNGNGKVSYRLKQLDTEGAFQYSQVIDVTLAAPSRFALLQNYPNPFSTRGTFYGAVQTRIAFEVPANYSGTVELKIYDVLGREVVTLVNKNLQPGYHEISWDGKDTLDRQVVSGVYMYVLKSDRFREVRKMILMQ